MVYSTPVVLFVNRFPFLDWMRGLAVVIMIQCHTFNSLTRMDLRDGGVLADVAPTLLQVLGLDRPQAMTGRSLVA